MSDTKLSALTAKSALAGTEETYINDGGVSKKVTVADLVASQVGKGPFLTGDNTVWDDYMIPGSSVKTTGTSPPDFTTSFAGNAGLDVFTFDGSSTLEQVFFTLQLPHTWKEGSTIYPHVHFSPTHTNGGDTVARVVRFKLEYTWANIYDSFGVSSTINLDSAAFVPNTSQWKHLLCVNGTGIAGTGKTLSSMLVCRLYRDPADAADTYPQDVGFLQFDIHFEKWGLGSANEYSN